ncbi:MAG: hypothetical protein JSR77_13875 [Planctomycetes bacterium]|nr:hypothetical protein [Planctomycetota bacterium]
MRFSSVNLAMTVRAASLGAALLVPFVVGGCQYDERQTFESTPYRPETVTLVNTATGEKVWTCDVPVGQKLEIAFKNKAPRGRELGYDEMTWVISGAASKETGKKNSVKVPPDTSRRLDVSLRPIPEAYPAPAAPTTK